MPKVYLFFKRFYLFIFRGEGREKKRERETFPTISCLSNVPQTHAPQSGTEPRAWACALTGNQTGDLPVLQNAAQATEPYQSGTCPKFNYSCPSADFSRKCTFINQRAIEVLAVISSFVNVQAEKTQIKSPSAT